MARQPRRGKPPDIALPRALEVAWGVGSRAGKGPRPGLTIARIVDAGVRIASTEGLAAVSMSRVAGEVGAATMSLYRYVGAKDELLALMVDAVYQSPPAPRGSQEGWRPALARWARAQLVEQRRHPWVLRIPISGPPITPNQTVWFERGLATLEGTGLNASERLSVLLLVSGFVRNEALLSADLQNAARAAGSTAAQATAAYGRLLARLTNADQFPAIARVLESGVFNEPDPPDSEFDFGLERILDGLAILIDKRSRPRRNS
jgi:AcrR family transcriptional regulator